jgi:NHLM bacteriocin system ABC transporter ATP-binding protein
MQATLALADILAAESTPYPVGGNRPFALDDPAAVWLVYEGKIELFLVQTSPDETDESRYYVCSVPAGQALFGTDSRKYGEGLSLLAVAQPETRLVRLSQDRLREMAQDSDLAGEVRRLVDGWASNLADSLTGYLLAPRAEVQLEPGETGVADPRQKIAPRRGNLWLTFRRSDVLYLGEESFGSSPTEICFPVYGKTWLTARHRCSLSADNLENLIGQAAVWDGLNSFHKMFFQVKFTSVRLAAYDQINRLRQKAEYDSKLKTKTLDFLSSVVDQKDTETELVSTADNDGLVEASKLIGRKLGIKIQKPANYKPGARYRNYPAELATIARASRVRTREVKLEEKWWTTDAGPLLAIRQDPKRPVALLPVSKSEYVMVDPADGSRVKVTAAVAENLQPQAYSFYRSFPDKKLTTKDLLKFGFYATGSDRLVILALATIAGILGLFTPILTGNVFDSFIPTGNTGQIVAVGIVLGVVALSGAALQITRSIAVLRLESRLDFSLQAAIWDRLLNLPTPFFRQYSSGDLASRALGIEQIRHLLSSSVATAVLNSVFSLFSFGLLFFYDLGLALVAFALTVVTLAIIGGISVWQLRYQRLQTEKQGKLSGAVLQLITGIAKLRVAGAEVRAFASWAKLFGEQRRLTFRARLISNLQTVFSAAWPAVTFLVIFGAFGFVANPKLTVGNFLAFLTAFGQFFTAMIGLAVALITVSAVIPIYERTKPILETLPEVDLNKTEPGELSGAIEVSNVTFRYAPDLPPVLNNISLTVQPGQMVAIVGPSGSGKSSLLRLLLGFEKPETGSIYYDRQDLANLDIGSVRRQLGVVIQNGRLMTGDIFSNIVGSMPYTQEQAWEAARMAGMEQDIKDMPMGMFTLVSEGGGNLSGGQRQRLMIARAIINKPRILLFDEATSALDNETQAIVSRSLESLKATRIVIAHRLSTIVNADCIYVVSGGKIVQSGTYADLLEQEGPFRELARRQLA